MKDMKKLIAALLVLALALALNGAALASCQFSKGTRVEFKRNAAAYFDHYNCEKSDTVVRKGSIAVVRRTYGDNWVELYLNAGDESKTAWFKTSSLKKTCKVVEIEAGSKTWEVYVFVCYAKGGENGSDTYMGPFNDSGKWFDDGGYRISENCYKRVKATGNVWMHKEPSLNRQCKTALRKNDKVSYRRKWALDDRLVPFYGIRYRGKCLWVSAQYSKLVK